MIGPEPAAARGRPGPAYYALTALSVSVGWGIRGNYGHEYGAMIAGVLGALAVVLTSGRDDWCRRVAYFATFGALGWSFGGSMSYMQVVAYTHSGHSPSVLYGFAALFLIGFLWAAPGGAGTAFAAFADRDRLTELFAPSCAVFLAWWLQGVALVPWLTGRGVSLDWFDTDWLAALLAAVAVLLLALARGRFDRATALVLHLAVGWWAGFLILVVGLGLRMTPPRGDNWAGCLGLTVGLLTYCARTGLRPVARAGLMTGLLGGIGFAAAAMLKLAEVTSGYDTNWHSVMEQTAGLFHGLSLAVAMAGAVRTAPRVVGEPPSRRWTGVAAVGFVLLGVTYLNLRKDAPEWVRVGAVPGVLAGLPAWAWFDLAYLAVALAVLIALARHLSRPLPALAMSWRARGVWLYLVFLGWIVVGNFGRVVVAFTPVRLVTEGVIHLNAAACALILLLSDPAPVEPSPPSRPRARLVAALALAAGVSVVADWGVVRAIYGDRFAGHAKLHTRFGPNAVTSRPARPPG